MPACNLTDFSITIQGEQAPYTTVARYGGASARADFAPTVNHPDWRSVLYDLEQTMFSPDEPTIKAIGSRLFHALFHADARDLWIAARADLDYGRVEGLRLRLDLQPADVAALPWEALYDPDRNVAFAASSRMSLVRVATLYRHLGPARRLHVSLPLRVLIVAPDDPGAQLDSVREIANTKQVLQTLGQRYVSIETMTGRFSITDLRRRLAISKPTVLHFIGHGEPDGLWLWRRNQPVLVTSASWRAALERAASVKLVLLNACLAAQTAGSDLFAGVSTQMLQVGVPAVIGMQTPIRDDAAIDFAHFFYEELLCGPCPGSIDLAVDAARGNLYALNPGDFSYGTPLLWLNDGDGRVFIPNGGYEPCFPGTEPDSIPQLDLAAESRWLDEMVATDLGDLPAEYSFVRSKWQNLLDELRHLLHQMHALSDQAASDGYAAKLAEYKRYKAALLRLQRLLNEATGKS